MTASIGEGIDIGGAASSVGQWGIVVTLLGIIVTLIRIQITRTEQREVAARDDCEAKIAAAVAPLEHEIARLRRLLGVVSRAIVSTNPDLARYLRVDGIEPPDSPATPAAGIPVTRRVDSPPDSSQA